MQEEKDKRPGRISKIARLANARLVITAVQYRQLGDIECASWE